MKKLLFIVCSIVSFSNFAGDDVQKQLASANQKNYETAILYKQLGDAYYFGTNVVKDFLAAKACYGYASFYFYVSSFSDNSVWHENDQRLVLADRVLKSMHDNNDNVENDYHIPATWLPHSVLTRFVLSAKNDEKWLSAVSTIKKNYEEGSIEVIKNSHVVTALDKIVWAVPRLYIVEQ